MGSSNYLTELAILNVVNKLNSPGVRALTFGQIYLALICAGSKVPSITECVLIVNTLVEEGLVISKKAFEPDPGFPYTLHLISGLTEMGAAVLKAYIHCLA